MKSNLLAKILLPSLFLLSLPSQAIELASNDKVAPTEIPASEKEFVDSINGFSKEQILQQLGEPSVKNEITNAKTGKQEAMIWHYHYINKDAQGEYYKTTELDFVDDKVVMVVFMNGDGEDIAFDGKEGKVPMPKAVKPEL